MTASPESVIEVLVIDDSAIVRQAFAMILTREPGMVVTVAADPLIAIEKMRRHAPDVIVLDLEMPRMDGLTFLERLMAEHPVPVVVCSGLTTPNTALALRALELGAVTVVAKPEIGVREFLHGQADDLATTIRNAAEVRVRRRSKGHANPTLTAPEATNSDPFLPTPIAPGTAMFPVGIGASMGGVEAVSKVLTALPPGAPPVLVVQHMPPEFTGAFARRLDELCRIEVREAKHGDAIRPGLALIAPGDRHLTIQRSTSGLTAVLADGPRVSGHRPSVDLLFNSLARVLGAETVGVLLTGMGEDGAEGLLTLRQAGALTIAQDESTSTVWGMPKAAIDRKAAAVVLPLARIAGTVLVRARSQRPVPFP